MISVIVIGKDEGERLGACLRSVREALGPLSHELIYVDSHSTDGSLAAARAQGARCFSLRETRTTAGLGRWAGAREAKGEYLLFLDGDMRLCPGFAQAALTAMERTGCEAATGQREDVYLRLGEVVGRKENYFGCTQPRLAPEFGGALMIRAEALARAGGWAADTVSCEEAELHARLAGAGVRVLELPVPMIVHEDAVREARSPLGVLFSARRLGEGQAFACALSAGKAGAYLRREREKFLFYAADWVCVLLAARLACALCAPGGASAPLLAAALGGCGFLQAAQAGFLLARARARAFVSQKLFFFAFPAGLLTYRRRSRAYDAV